MRILFLFISVLVLGACTNTTEKTAAENPEAEIIKTAVTPAFYGDSIDTEGAMSPSEFLAEMAGKDTMKAKLRAEILETCTRKGCWMTLDMGDGNEMHVKFKDYGFFVPTEGMEGKTVVIAGYAHTDTVTVKELRHLAEDAGKSEDQIAAITKPEIGTGFIADGVVVVQ